MQALFMVINVMNDTNSNTAPTLNRAKFLAWIKSEGHDLALEITALQAFAQVVRAEVNARTKPIFARYSFKVHPEFHRCGAGEAITDQSKLYLAGNAPEVAAYDAEVEAAHRAAGWKGAPGTCPALVAEAELIKAENAFIKAASNAAEFDFTRAYGKTRDEFLRLTLGACIAGFRK